MKAQLLAPGFLVHLSVVIKGGTEYEQLKDAAVVSESGTLTQRMESIKTIADVEEQKLAVALRGEARYMVSKHCRKTPFCLLLQESESAEQVLEDAIRNAKAKVEAFNETSVYSKLSFYCIKARLLANDEQTAKMVSEEMRALLAEVSLGIKAMDEKAIRESLKKANDLASMLAEEQQEKISASLEMARVAAREITKAVKKAGGDAAKAIGDWREEVLALEAARQVFLDFEEPIKLSAEQEAPPVQAVELDLSSPEEEKPNLFTKEVWEEAARLYDGSPDPVILEL